MKIYAQAGSHQDTFLPLESLMRFGSMLANKSYK
jgi:hypothetical protein